MSARLSTFGTGSDSCYLNYSDLPATIVPLSKHTNTVVLTGCGMSTVFTDGSNRSIYTWLGTIDTCAWIALKPN